MLRCVEINSSFYRPHRREVYRKWATQTPRTFRFSVKLPRQITHEARLRGARSALDEFLAQAGGLGRRLGPLLVQLPPSLEYEPRIANRFFALMRERHAGEIVCEPRHPSWFDDVAESPLVRFRIARVAADPALLPAAAPPGRSRSGLDTSACTARPACTGQITSRNSSPPGRESCASAKPGRTCGAFSTTPRATRPWITHWPSNAAVAARRLHGAASTLP